VTHDAPDLTFATTLTQARVLRLWIPLAAMWLLMGIEPPLVAAGVARLPQAKLNLAAFGVSFAIVLLFESPVIQLLAAATALADGSRSYRRLRRFTHVLAGGLTGLHLITALSPLYPWLAGDLMGVPAEVVQASRPGFLVLFPWGGAIAYRRLWQGVLIRYGRSRVIPVTMAVRIAAGVLVLLAGIAGGTLAGAFVGALALSVGVVSAAVCAWFYARPIVRRQVLSAPGTALPWADLMRFYVPLALTTILLLAVRPVVTTGLARAPDPMSALALWPVLTGFLFMLNSLGISYQEVVISLLSTAGDRRVLARFALLLAACLAAAFLAIVATPLGRLWFRDFSDLPPDLLPMLSVPLAMLVPLPSALTLIALLRGFLIQERRTTPVTEAMAVNFALVAALMLLAAPRVGLPGLVSAAGAMLLAALSELACLWRRTRRSPAPTTSRQS
jgi:hypothetical protein